MNWTRTRLPILCGLVTRKLSPRFSLYGHTVKRGINIIRVTTVKNTHEAKRLDSLPLIYKRELSTGDSQDVIHFPWKMAALMLMGIPFSVYLYKCIMLVLFQNKLIYMPSFPLGSRSMSFDEIPIDERLDCQKVVVDTKDKHKLFGIIVKHKFSSKHNDLDPILIYFQGNAGNVLARIPIFSRILLSSSKGSVSNLQIIAISYRGYWLSTGSPSEVGIQKDSMSIYEFVREVYPKNPIYIYGHSLGGAVALHLASDPRVQKDLKGIIIENTFTSIEDMVTTIYPQKWLPYRYLVHIPLLLRNKWDNKRVIREISTPIMFLSSKKDELVPQDQMRELHELSRTSKVWVEFKNALHEDIFFHRGYCEAIYQFINETKL